MEYFAQAMPGQDNKGITCDALKYKCGIEYPLSFGPTVLVCVVLLLMLGILLFARHRTKGLRGKKFYTIASVVVVTLLALAIAFGIWSVLQWRGVL